MFKIVFLFIALSLAQSALEVSGNLFEKLSVQLQDVKNCLQVLDNHGLVCYEQSCYSNNVRQSV